MSDYIDENARITDDIHNAYEEGYADGMRDAVKHGHWESITDYYHMCSCCGKGITGYFGKPPEESVALYAKYCQNCGAQMDVPDINVGNKSDEVTE